MLDAIIKWIGGNVSEILLGAIAWILALGLRELRRAPKLLVALAEHFALEAKKTPGVADDAAAAFFVALANAIAGAVEQTFGRALPASSAPDPAPRRGPNP